YVSVCWFLVIVQSSIGLGIAALTDTSSLTGLMAGYPSMQGGHGMAGSLAPVAEGLGESNALTVGMAAATFGLIAGSLIGGPVGNMLIKKNNLKIETDTMDSEHMEELTQELEESQKDKVNSQNVFISGAIIFISLAIGMPIAEWITEVTGFSIPGHIFSLFLGIIFRSVNDQRQFIHVSDKSMDVVFSVSLNMFLVMSIREHEIRMCKN